MHLLLGLLIDAFLQDCQTAIIISKENLFLLRRVLRMNSISYPQMTIFFLSIFIIWPWYILSLSNILLAWSHLSFIASHLFSLLAGHSLNCVPFQSNTCSIRQSAKYHSPGYPLFLEILIFFSEVDPKVSWCW